MTRCENGTRRNKQTGKCVPHSKKMTKKIQFVHKTNIMSNSNTNTNKSVTITPEFGRMTHIDMIAEKLSLENPDYIVGVQYRCDQSGLDTSIWLLDKSTWFSDYTIMDTFNEFRDIQCVNIVGSRPHIEVIAKQDKSRQYRTLQLWNLTPEMMRPQLATFNDLRADYADYPNITMTEDMW